MPQLDWFSEFPPIYVSGKCELANIIDPCRKVYDQLFRKMSTEMHSLKESNKALEIKLKETQDKLQKMCAMFAST
jgi:hypothetical protein